MEGDFSKKQCCGATFGHTSLCYVQTYKKDDSVIDAVTDFKARLLERLEELERCNNPKLDDSDYGYAHAIDEVKKIIEEL